MGPTHPNYKRKHRGQTHRYCSPWSSSSWHKKSVCSSLSSFGENKKPTTSYRTCLFDPYEEATRDHHFRSTGPSHTHSPQHRGGTSFKNGVLFGNVASWVVIERILIEGKIIEVGYPKPSTSEGIADIRSLSPMSIWSTRKSNMVRETTQLRKSLACTQVQVSQSLWSGEPLTTPCWKLETPLG